MPPYLSRLCALCLAVLAPFTIVFSQSSPGWELIRANDFTAARAAFETTLAQHPRDEAALTGLLFLAETVQNHEAYAQASNRLVEATNWSPALVWLFDHMLDAAPADALRRPLPPSLHLPFAARQADTLFRQRRFDEAAALRATIVPEWPWLITGPFNNTAGSGFIEPTPVEAPFDRQARFRNDAGREFGWLEYKLRAPGRPIDFDPLPGTAGLATFYAQTFVNVPAARRVALRITRSQPLKIWLDDEVLVERPRPAALALWDAEVVEFDLPAGIHRLLVKIAEFPVEDLDSRVQLEYNDWQNDGDASFEGSNFDYDEEEGFARRHDDDYETAFALRFTDPVSGELLSDLTARADGGNYAPARAPWMVDFRGHDYLVELQRVAEAAPDALWRHYLLAKAFAKARQAEAGEEYFAAYARRYDDSAFARFLLAKFYDANDKGERAEALLSELDTAATPTFAEQYTRLMKINSDQEEPHYLAAMERMLTLSPTNWTILNRYLRFLKEKGRRDQLQGFVRGFLERYNSTKWKHRLETYLEDESYKPASYKPQSERERDKAFKQAEKRLRKRFDLSDVQLAVQYYRQRERTDDVVRLYREVALRMPWNDYFPARLAEFLFEKGRQDEALAVLRSRLEVRPYQADLYELVGDIYVEKKQPAEALRWYRQAEKILGTIEGFALGAKIEKIENRAKYHGYFAPLVLADEARDRRWEAAYGDADAVVALFAQQIVYRHDAQRTEALRKAVIHIRTDAGAKLWTEADLRLLGQITSAKVLRKDGTVTSPDLGWGMAVFKNLQPGDVILVEGTSDNAMPNEIPGEFLDVAALSWPAPVARATFELLVPRDQPVYAACNRLDCNYTTRDTGAFRLLRWEWRDIARIEDEEATPDNFDPTAWMMLGSAPDWSAIVRWYEQKTYCRTEPNYEVLAKARDLLQPGMSKAAIVETLHNYITREINYSYVPFLNNNYTPKTPGATLSGKVGDCKDVATLMITLLRDHGVPAWYTLVSTHAFSEREPRPTLYAFNHAIVAYELDDGVLRFADLTTDYFPSHVLPDGDCDAWALVIRPGEKQLRRLPNHALDPALSRVEVTARAVLDGDGNLAIDARTVRHGTAAGNWREIFLRATADERRKKLSEYFGGGVLKNVDLESFEFANLDSINAPLETTLRFKAYRQLDKVSTLYILPVPLPLSLPTQKALFAARRYNDLDADVLFELAPVRETVELALPARYSLAEMPKARVLKGAFGTYRLEFEAMPGGLRVRREVTFAKRFIEHGEFAAFKQFYLEMLDADDAYLALKKK
jgi:hypothetical protein